jgi:hypothetical protein
MGTIYFVLLLIFFGFAVSGPRVPAALCLIEMAGCLMAFWMAG